jgi:hypothetical protein
MSEFMTSTGTEVQTSFQTEDTEIRRFPFFVPVSVGTRIVLDGEYRDRDLQVLAVSLLMDEAPVLVVEVGERLGPGPTPVS